MSNSYRVFRPFPLVGMGGGVAALITLIASPQLQAATQRLTYTLTVEPGETYAELLIRAESLASGEIESTFSANVVTSDVSLVIMGENNGLVTPLLSVDVRRDNWRNNPNLSAWAQYYPNARDLLALDSPILEADAPELGTGDIQVTLRWDTLDDLDVAVVDPNNETVFFANPNIPSGGTLDVDSNAGCQANFENPVENIYWETGSAPEGEYVATVTLFSNCSGNLDPVPFELSITTGGETRTETGTVSEDQPTLSFPFTFP